MEKPHGLLGHWQAPQATWLWLSNVEVLRFGMFKGLSTLRTFDAVFQGQVAERTVKIKGDALHIGRYITDWARTVDQASGTGRIVMMPNPFRFFYWKRLPMETTGDGHGQMFFNAELKKLFGDWTSFHNTAIQAKTFRLSKRFNGGIDPDIITKMFFSYRLFFHFYTSYRNVKYLNSLYCQ